MQNVTMNDIYEAQKKLGELRWEYWRSEVVFSLPWWSLLAATLAVIVLWIKLSDPKRRHVLALYIFATVLIASLLDVCGAELMLWDYPAMLLPWGARLLCVDLMISLLLSLAYQRYAAWRKFLIAVTVMAAVFAFILEPLTIWLDIYSPYKWKSLYSFPFYILLAASTKRFSDFVVRGQAGSGRQVR